MRKRIQKISIILGITLIIVLCAGFLFIRSEAFLNWVEKRLETELESRITKGYTADIGNIKGSILGNVTISSVKISKEGEPVISTRRAVLKYNLLGLLTRKFEVKELRVDEPIIHVKHDPDSSLNLSNIFHETPSTQNSSQFSFAVEKIRLDRGTIDYTDTQRDLDITVQGITITFEGALDTWDHEGEWRIENGNLRFNGAETKIDNFEGGFSLTASGGRLDNLLLKFGNSSLEVTDGELPQGVTDTPWNRTVNVELDVADIGQFLGEEIALEGAMSLNFEVESTNSTLAIKTLTAQMPMFSMTQKEKNRKIALTDLDIDANFDSEPIPTFTLKTFSVQVADSTLTGKGSISLQNALEGDLLTQLQQLTQHPIVYEGQWNTTDVKLIPLLSMFVQIPEYLADSTGLLSGTGTFNGNSTDFSTFKLNSTIEIIETTLNEVALEDSTLNCTIAVGELKVNGNLDETEINITGAFPLVQQDALDIRASKINFDDLMRIVNTADLGGTGEYTAKLSSDGTLKGFMRIPNASFNDIPLGVLAGDLRYQNGHVFIENGLLTKNTEKETLTTYESRTTINGVVGVEGEFPAEFTIIADPVYVQHYPRILLGTEYPVNGEIRGELKIDGTLINLDGSADFSVTEGVAWGIHLDPLTLPLRIEDYNIAIPNFEIITRGQKVTLNVSVAPNADYDLLLESDAPVNFQELSKAAQISHFPFDGQFDVSVVGTLKKPEPVDFQVKLDFANITYLDIEDSGHVKRFPLGDAVLHGKLVELKNITGKPDRFDFTGSGFNGQIQGYVSIAPDNPYKFEVKSQALEVTPILRILHPALEAVTGTADGRAEIEGTVAALAPTDENKSGESLTINSSTDTFAKETRVDGQKQRIYPYVVDIEIDTSQLYYGNPRGKPKTPFTNAEPIRLSLKDDTWTANAFSLRTSEDKLPFVELTGTFDAKSEAIDLYAKSDGFALSPFAPAVGLLPDAIPAGTGRYTAKITGTSKHPIIMSDWVIPKLDLKTEVGDIRISDAGGAIIYQDNLMHLEKTALKLLGNVVDIGGEISVSPEDINNSQLNLSVNAPELELTTFGELIAKASANSIKAEDLRGGVLGTSIAITGTPAKTLIAVNAQTAPQSPIRLAPNVHSITLESLQADAILDSEFLHIQLVEANGQIGDGSYTVQGDASFSTRDTDARQFSIDASVSQLGIADFVTLFSGQTPPFRCTVSGHAKLSGKGNLHPHQVSISGEVSELNFQGYRINCTNTTPLQFQSERGDLTVHLPLKLKSPEMVTTANVNITGTFEAPEITAEWNGNINQMEWNGKVQYRDERITVDGIELKNSAGMTTITGVIPFDLAFTAIDLPDRFPEQPIDLHFRGRELPLDFFPGIDTLFSEADGTVDIDLALQGTSRSPYIIGNVSLEAVQLQLKNFHEPIRNMKMKLNAREDAIDLTELGFDMGTGYCMLQQGQLALDGLTPKDFTLTGLKFELFPLGSTVQQALPPEVLEEVDGHLSTTLSALTVPLDSFLTKGENTPFPQIRKLPSFADIVAVSNAKLSINSVRLTFKVLDQPYDFQDPRPIQIMLNAGTVTLPKAFTLENQYTFPVKQTFTAEDEKPDGVADDVDVYTVEDAKTTLSIDAGSQWSVNGEFDAALRFNNFNVSALTSTWSAPYRITGALSGSLQISGTSEDPKITLRRHKSEPAELYLHDIPIDLRWRIRYQNGKWEISKKRYVEVKFGENLLNFSWEMPYQLELIPFLMELQRSPAEVWQELRETKMEGILDIEINDLDLLRSMVPGLESATGKGEIHVKLSETFETPEAEGHIGFENIGFELSDVDIRVKEINGKITLTEKGATIEQFSGNLNDGDFSITGSVIAPEDRRIWQTPPKLDLSASISSSVFEQDEKYEINLGSNSTEFGLSGNLAEPKLTGNLNISGGYYQQNWESVRDWLAGTSVSEIDVVLDQPILRDLDLDVAINIPDNFRVLSSITGPTDIEIACSGRLIGRIIQPIFNGSVSLRSGKVGLVYQTFEIIGNSTIINQNDSEFNPTLNIMLRTQNRIRGVLPRDGSALDVYVQAWLTGTLRNQTLTLSAPTATQALTQEDLMEFLFQNAAFSRAFGGFTFNFHRPHDVDARSISAEYQLRENMSIKIENNEKGEYSVDFEMKGRF